MKPVISQYYPGDSWLHRADPRAKFVAVLALAVALFVRDSFAALAIYAAAGVPPSPSPACRPPGCGAP